MCIGEQNVEGGKIYLNNKSIEQIPIHLRSKEGLAISHSKEPFSICRFMIIFLVLLRFL